MNIAMLTTWASNCGIAEYSKNLLTEFELQRHNILLLNNKIDVHTPKDCTIAKQVFSEDMKKRFEEFKLGAFVAAKVFGVYWWGEDAAFNADDAELKWALFEQTYGPIDVLHVQYQSSLYEPKGFNKFMSGITCKKVVTQHDSSRNSKHDFDVFDVVITHSFHPSVRKHQKYFGFTFPTIERTPVVFSFGMGRNNYDFIEQACKEIGVDFESHDARKDGWLSEDILFERMNSADAIVLWYNDVSIEGQSAALRTAISSMRPVIVNDIPWFRGAPDFVYKIMPIDISEEFTAKAALQATLYNILHLGYLRQHSFKKLAEKHMEIYNGR